MALNAWQRIDRVMSGKPWGDGSAGAYSSATAPTMTRKSCSGTSGSTTLTIGSADFTNGDIVLIHQSRGTGVGQWEINKVSSGGGSTSLTLDKTLQYTYTDSGASQAQVIKIPLYSDVTIQSGTWTVPSWDNDTGGILVFAANGTITPTGTVSASGTNGGVGTSGGGSAGCGFSGGNLISNASNNQQAQSGEGTTGDHANQTTANGNGGGGASYVAGYKSGGGGGNGAAGSAGTLGNDGTSGAAGSTGGNSGLTSIVFGGGGGGAARKNTDQNSGGGASGAGIIMIFGKTVSTISQINAVGGIGGSPGTGASKPGGGSGAGGSVLLVANTIDIGTNKIDTRGGVASTADAPGGAGGNGRVAVYYNASLSGSLSSTYYGTLTSEQDTSLVEVSPSFFAMF